MVTTMGPLALLSFFILSPLVIAAPSPFPKRSVVWGGCSVFGINSTDPNLSCGYYEVPMDYHDPNAGKARLAVAKYAATAAKKAGTLFLNPGGPGGSGVELIAEFGEHLTQLFLGSYDLVSWDPRGVGLYTFPGAVTCFNSLTEETMFFKGSIVEGIDYTITGGFDQQEQAEFFSHADQYSTSLTEFGKKCQQGPVGKYLPYIGTTSTIRDLVSLGDAIVGVGKPIDFWGFSYGTVIGANFLNMFPERAGHVILDGVVDPTIWVSHKTLRSSLVDAEGTCVGMATACAASGKAGCKLIELVGDGATGPDVIKLIIDAHDTAVHLQQAGYTKLPVTPTEMRGALFGVLHVPATWSAFANGPAYELFATIFQAAKDLNIPYGNYTIPTLVIPDVPPQPDPPVDTPVSHAFDAIVGGDDFADAENHVAMKDVLTEIVGVTQTVSPAFGAIWKSGYTFGWPVRSVERLPPLDYSKLKGPVLVVGNTADPITPFASAQHTAQLIGSHATLVEQLGFGHTSVAQFSTCTFTIIAEYLLASKLPTASAGSHVKCVVDPTNPLFPPLNTTTPKRGLHYMMQKRR